MGSASARGPRAARILPPAPEAPRRRGSPARDSCTGPSPLPRPVDWEAERRERLIQEEVRRRLVEEEVRREFEARGDLAFARAGWGPDPFFAPGCFVPPPHAPMPMHPPPYAPPPPVHFYEFGAWQGFGPCRHAGSGERMPFPCGAGFGSPPRQKPQHKLKLLQIEPSGRPEVPRMKRKEDANAAATVPKKVQKLAKDWSCALCQVSATCEAGLNEHLGGRKHKAKLALCGASKAIKDDKNCSQMTTGNKNSTDPCDAPKKICLLVDGEVHEVFRKNNYLWCDRCRVRCDSNVIMTGHLRSKKHSKLNKVWASIRAVRTNTDTKEGLATSGSQICPQEHSSGPQVLPVDHVCDPDQPARRFFLASASSVASTCALAARMSASAASCSLLAVAFRHAPTALAFTCCSHSCADAPNDAAPLAGAGVVVSPSFLRPPSILTARPPPM
ncbi:hypothetical protein ZWY2020_000628 [Hordeum vulgare]|nr:hypothetical protein ZWY2020_000628 [Hordeum vulgare]